MRTHSKSWWLWLALVCLAACGGDEGGKANQDKRDEDPQAEARIDTLEFHPGELSLEEGESAPVTVTLLGQGDFDGAVTWATAPWR